MFTKKSRLAILRGKNTYTLAQAVDIFTQREVALWLGVTDEAVRHMLKTKREIYIELDRQDDYLSSVEIKPVGKANVSKRNKATAN